MTGFFNRLKAGLKKTAALFTPLVETDEKTRTIDASFWDDLEAALITADLGPAVVGEMLEKLKLLHADGAAVSAIEILDALQKLLVMGIPSVYEMKIGKNPDGGPSVILLVGVNGVGKTTTAAKLARYIIDHGKTAMLAAADTFRAAAGEQLDIWAARVGVEIIRHDSGADPAAVVFDACAAATARKVDYVIVDTAGRLHTRENLLKQLEKICRVAQKQIPSAPHEVLLILDATTGQNALAQARKFTDNAGVTGIVLTKLDGTAKGGVAMAINREIRLPIKFIGVGEKETDLMPFNPEEFCRALFSGLSSNQR